MTVFLVILATSAALVIGALWGVRSGLTKKTEGFIVAMAGGALIVSVMEELIGPSLEVVSIAVPIASVLGGAVGFAALDAWVEERLSQSGGFGLLLAVTLDGVPENLALGSAMIGADALSVLTLAGSIFLSNLPEAAGGAKRMHEDGRSRVSVILLWGGVTVLLACAALLGFYGLSSAPDGVLATIKCVAAGAVLASLATEVFPKAYEVEAHWAGVAVAIGLILALCLSQVGA